jgi:hypothetical protein
MLPYTQETWILSMKESCTNETNFIHFLTTVEKLYELNTGMLQLGTKTTFWSDKAKKITKNGTGI